MECWVLVFSSYLYRAEHINNVVMLGTVQHYLLHNIGDKLELGRTRLADWNICR